ncbi:LysM peptidoglycan-binding domain-containing protein [Brevibacterium sp. UCMA 11754]|uniref:LysM peptidoglycan-binding domain-containing protein n=1 Tax=Brevibacterium sp. UCMA 11754 TaxID=2749198 RepID=UPI001F29B13E|nr:LysM peptidoglycan-binding domain-containing protein [Brevibacterium sp. UCMA 11754]MCF2572924.1 LysM peptidoglycan-binding domain-containing protein [Brevibacterium sp. UCMA 11754]
MSAQNQELRFTARGRQAMRLLRTMVCALVIIGGAFFVATQSFSAAAGAETEDIGIDTEAVVVGEGESLWAVASNLGIERDTRDVVSEIVEINHLSSPVVHPGQTLDVPRR